MTESLESDLARLRSELASVRDVLAQRDRALVAAHRVIEIAQADAAALWGCMSALIARGLGALLSPSDADAVQRVLIDHPGAALLAELDAARAVVEAARDYKAATDTLDGIGFAEHTLFAAVADYDRAMKAQAKQIVNRKS